MANDRRIFKRFNLLDADYPDALIVDSDCQLIATRRECCRSTPRIRVHDVVEEELLRDGDRFVSDLDDSKELVAAVKDAFCVGYSS